MTNSQKTLIAALASVTLLVGCNESPRGERSNNNNVTLNERTIEANGGTQVVGEIWVDNWFSLSVNGAPLIEDSVEFNTERSFNAERVTFNTTLPATLAFELRDFKENDTGLEYIGTNRQQMGDGGMIAQFRDAASDAVIAVSDSSVRCLVVHRAPIDTACADENDPTVAQGACASIVTETPANWTAADFDDSQWTAAVEHSVRAVSPKDGYDEIEWDPSARLIWSDDLVQDNTVLCRMTIIN